jgi:sugar lactone lactonase YvrE
MRNLRGRVAPAKFGRPNFRAPPPACLRGSSFSMSAALVAMCALTVGCNESTSGSDLGSTRRSVTVSDSESHTVDGQGLRARFGRPAGLAFDSKGDLYVADAKDQVIRIVSPAGDVRTFAGSPGHVGHKDGFGSTALFAIPTGLAIDSHDNLYVADSANETVRKIAPDGVVTTYAGLDGRAGVADGDFRTAMFDFPEVIAIGPNDVLYVISEDSIRAVTADRSVKTVAGMARVANLSEGERALDAVALHARFSGPGGLAIDPNSNIYIADSGDMTIRRLDPQGWVRPFAGGFTHPGYRDGERAAARFNQPRAMLVSPDGVLFVADCHNAKIRRIATSGLVSSVASVGCAAGIAMDRQGWLYVSVGGIQPGSRRPGSILRVSPDGVVSTFVGGDSSPAIARGDREE